MEISLTFERQYIGWGNNNDPLEMVIRFYIPTDYEKCHYHDKLHEIEGRFIRAGYDTEIGYSDGVVCVFKK